MTENLRFQPGDTFSHYKIHEFLRSENIYDIYLAEPGPSEEMVLLWVIPERWADADVFERLRGKISELKQLEHPNLLPILDFGQEDSILFWSTPSIQGTLLSAQIQERTEAQAASIVYQIAEACEYLHANKQVHAGIQPENIIVNQNDQVILINYGLFPFFNLLVDIHTDEHLVGFGVNRPDYMAPEQMGMNERTRSSDIYALGALYYALLTPGSNTSAAELLFQRSVKPVLAPAQLKRKLSKSSVRLLWKINSVDPKDRYRRISDVLPVLKKLSNNKPAWIRLSARQSKDLPARYKNHFARDIFMVIVLCLLGFAGWQAYSFDLINNPLVNKVPAIASEPTATMAIPEQQSTEIVAAVPTGVPTQGAMAATPTSAEVVIPIEKTVDTQSIVLLNTPVPKSMWDATPNGASGVSEVARLANGKFFHAAWSPNGTQLAVASSAGVYILSDNKIVHFLDTGTWATSVQYSLEGDILAVGLESGDIQLWQVSSWEKTHTFTGHTNRVSRVLFSPNRRHLISASYDLHIMVWDLTTFETVKRIPAHGLPIRDIAISTDGRILASAAGDQIIRVWDLGNFSKIGQYTHSSRVFAVAISGNGEYLAAGGDNGFINQWNLITGSLRVDPIPVKNIIWNLYYLHDDQFLVGLEGGSVRKVGAITSYFQAATEKYDQSDVTNELIREFGGQFEFPYFTALSKQGTTATISWKGTIGDQSIDPSGAYFESYNSLYISPNNRFLLAGGKRDTVSLIDLVTNKMVFITNIAIPTGSPFSQNSQYFGLAVSRTTYNTGSPKTTEELSIRNSLNGTEIYRLMPFINSASIDFSTNDTLLIATTMSQTRAWDLTSKYETYLTADNYTGCRTIRSSNNGEVFLAYLPTGTLPDLSQSARQICGLSSRLMNGPASISPSQRWILYINSSNWLELLTVSENKFLWRIPVEERPTHILISPDESFFLTGNSIGEIAAYNMQDGSLLWKQKAHTGAIGGLVIASDGSFIASASNDGTIRVWKITQ